MREPAGLDILREKLEEALLELERAKDSVERSAQSVKNWQSYIRELRQAVTVLEAAMSEENQSGAV